MQNQITTIDFNCDWFLRDYNLTPRSTPGEMSREDIIAFLGTLEVDAIELMHDYWKNLPAPSVRRIVDDAGLQIECYIFLLDLAQPPEQRDQAIGEMKIILERIVELGAPTGMIVPGLVKANYPLNKQRAWMIEGLRRCAELAENVDVTLLAENIDMVGLRPLMGRAAECRAICQAIDSPAFQLIYDCGATTIVHEDPIEALRTMAPWVAHVHLKNNCRLQSNMQAERYVDSVKGDRFTGCELHQGEIDVATVVSELGQLDYSGPIAIEYQGQENPREILPRNISFLRDLISGSKTN